MVQMATLEVSELFYSIQGESTYAGLPCIFIRLGGCNLRCSYCDAQYTFQEQTEKIEIATIIEYVEKYPDALIEVTGGEPLLQKNTIQLLQQLLRNNRKILIETNGSVDISDVPSEVITIIDIKCPDSGSENSFLPANLDHIKSRCIKRKESCEIKFVISSKKDYEWSKKLVQEKGLSSLCPILFSPVTDRIAIQDIAEMILHDQLFVRLQLQLHTFIWPGISRRV
jgi:7-carboxy-7-deazaguanine synthase